MDVTRFDTVNRALGRPMSRRGALRTGGAMVTALLAGSTVRARPVLAAPPPLPDVIPGRSGTESWPACSSERPDYCISRFEVAGVDRLANPDPALRLSVLGSKSQMDLPQINRLEWGLYDDLGGSQDLGMDMLNTDVVIGIRTGRFMPGTGMARAGGGVPPLAGNADAGWEITIPTRPVLMQLNENGDREQAEVAWVVCRGTFHNMAAGPERVSGPGIYVSSSANSVAALTGSRVPGSSTCGLPTMRLPAPLRTASRTAPFQVG